MTTQSVAAPAGEGREPDLRALLNRPGNRTVLLDGSRDPNGGVTMLLIPAGTERPDVAVKVATTAAGAGVIAREATLLTSLRRLPLGPVEPTIPKPAGLFQVDGMLAAATTVVPGVPMRTRYHGFGHLRRPEAVRADFAAAASWLADLHSASAVRASPISLLEGVSARITARWPGDPQASVLAGLLEPLAARLASGRTPRTVVHGDFWAGNVLVAGGGGTAVTVTGVVDWPDGQLAAEPLADVARFALTYALYLDRHTRPGRPVAGHPGLRADRWGAGLRYAIAGQHWFGRLVSEFVTAALHRLGAPAALWRDVLLAGIAEVAVTADHPDFAARHRDLLFRMLSKGDS
jgi:aminoglycoside phosphotransferase (APT) family kinase protein